MKDKGVEREGSILFFLLLSFMEISWLFSILLLVTSGTHYPFPPSWIYIFFLALLLGRVGLFSYRWQSFLVHLLSLLTINLYSLYQITGREEVFFRFHWIPSLLNLPLEERLSLLLLSFSLLFLYWGGLSLSQRPRDFTTISTRFDLGCGVFFFLFLAEGALDVSVLLPLPILSTFFLSSLFSMTLSRTTHKKERSKSRWVSYLFPSLLLLLLMSLLILSSPLLEEYAHKSYMLMESLAEPLQPYLISFLRFLVFGMERGISHTPQETYQEEGIVPKEVPQARTHPLPQILLRSIYLLLGLALLTLSGWILYRIVKWLSSPSRGRRGGLSLLLPLHSLLVRFSRWIEEKREPFTPIRAFKYLRSWGRRRGFKPKRGETPREYSHRIGERYPWLFKEFELIVQQYYQEVFGDRSMREEDSILGEEALRKIKNPLHWTRGFLYWLKRRRGRG